MEKKERGCIRMVWFLIFTIFFVSFFSLTGRTQLTANIGFVDLKTVIQEYKKYQKMQQKLTEQSQQNQGEFLQRKKEIEELKAKLKAQESLLTVEAVRERSKRIEEKEGELRAWQKQASTALSRQKKSYMEEILRDILAVIKTIAEQENCDFILDKGMLLYTSPKKRLDLTEKVILLLNEKQTKG